MRQSKRLCVVERRGAQDQRKWSSGVRPILQFEPPVQPRRIAESLNTGSVAPENEKNMVLQHDFERRLGSFNCGLEQWLEAGRWGGFAVSVQQSCPRLHAFSRPQVTYHP